MVVQKMFFIQNNVFDQKGYGPHQFWVIRRIKVWKMLGCKENVVSKIFGLKNMVGIKNVGNKKLVKQILVLKILLYKNQIKNQFFCSQRIWVHQSELQTGSEKLYYSNNFWSK